MWAQLIKARVKPGKEAEVRNLPQEFGDDRGSNPWERLMTFTDAKNPSQHYTLVFFESESKARQNEANPDQEKRFNRMQELFYNFEFVDLTPVYESS